MGLKFLTRTVILLIIFTQLFFAAVTSAEQEKSNGIGVAPPAKLIEFEAFLNHFFTREMSLFDIPGAVFVMVKEGKVFIEKGWGFEDAEKLVKIDPETTRFALAPLTKLFLATSILQLAERDLLELDDHANKHLNYFSLDSSGKKPPTIAHLLTHTAGFAPDIESILTERYEGLGQVYLNPSFVRPHQIHTPGETIGYSTYGYFLLKRALENITAKSFGEYASENIFTPLEMNESLVNLNSPELKGLAVGYKKDGGTPSPIDSKIRKKAYNGNLVSTASDIANFMIALINEGSFKGNSVLSSSSVETMLQRHFSFHEDLPGVTIGFREHYENDLRILVNKGGAGGIYHSLMLIPEKRSGLFIVYNRFEPLFSEKLLSTFLDKYYPSSNEFEEKEINPDKLTKLSGTYKPANRTTDPVTKLDTFFNEYKVSVNDSGSIELHYPFGLRDSKIFKHLGNFVFKNIKTEELATFVENNRGSVSHMVTGTTSLRRINWYETNSFLGVVLAVLMVVFFSAIAEWPFDHIIRRILTHRDQKSILMRLSRVIGWVTCFINLVLAGWLVHFFYVANSYDMLLYAPNNSRALLEIPPLSALLTSITVVFTILAWKKGFWGRLSRIHYTVVTASMVIFLGLLRYWNLL